jgi:hypothetical protein
LKLIRFGEAGGERPGVLLDEGYRVDVSDFVSDYDEGFFARGGIDALRDWLKKTLLPLHAFRPQYVWGHRFLVPAKSFASDSITVTMRRRLELRFRKSQSSSSKRQHP